jgi:hypothetical protein
MTLGMHGINVVKKIATVSLVCVGLLLAACSAKADSIDFTAIASSPVSAPGTTVGWAYSITNNTSNILVAMGLDAGNFDPNSGFIDTGSLFDFPIIGPGSTVAQPYDPINFTGLAQFTWSVTAAPGTVESGQFFLDLYTSDANGDPLAFFGTFSTPFSISTPNIVPAPEPGSLILLASGLLGLLLLSQRGSRST